MKDLVALLISLIIILVLFKFRVHLGLTMLLSGLFLCLTYKFSARQIMQTFLSGFFSKETLEISLSLGLIIIFNRCMEAGGTLRKVMNELENLFSDTRWIIGIIPAIVGFLPMFGGALVSAPVVKQATEDDPISNERKTFLNFWFRHVWEYTLPLYPGVLVAAGILGVPVYKIIVSNSILTISAIIIGIVVGISKLEKHTRQRITSKKKTHAVLRFLFNLSPIITVILLVALFRLRVIYALVIATALTVISNKTSLKVIAPFSDYKEYGMILIVFAIMAFKEVLTNTGLIERLPMFLNSSGIPRYLVISFLPFIVGFLTGITMASIGVTFPVILSLFGGKLSLMTFSYMCGFAGVLLTPVHFCLALTKEYFRADWLKLYKEELILPIVLMVGIAFVYSLF